MKGKKLRVTLSYIALILIALISVIPFWYVISIALKNPLDAFSTDFKFFFKPTLENFKQIWVHDNFGFYFKNSIIVTAICVLISVPMATFGAYGLIRHDSKFSNRILNSMLGLRMFPAMLLVIPYFMLATTLKLTDTYTVLILIIVASNQPFAIWLMRGFLLGIPRDLDEAARVDGCNLLTTVTKVVLPLCMPGIGTASIFTCLLSYNEYLFALVLSGKRTMTLPVAVGKYAGEELVYWCQNAAAVVSIILPICIVMIFLQKWLVKGLTAGAVKG